VANPLSSVTSAYHAAQISETQTQSRNAAAAPKKPAIPQDTVTISQSAKAANQAATAKSTPPSADSEFAGENK